MSATDFEISFVIPELTDAFDSRVSQVEESIDLVVSSHGGFAVATVIAPARGAVDAGRAASAILSACGLPPQRTYPDLVSRQDIAERLDVSRQAVGNWVRGERHHATPFPAPVNLVAGGVWLWGDIVDWLRSTGRDEDELSFPTLEEHALLDGILATATGVQPKSHHHREVAMRSIGSVTPRIGFAAPTSNTPANVGGNYVVLCQEPA